ncbi:hypothetical protein MMC25_002503 [Agyrium rufum]|nr:hypothetical protein [Agyrium rufum]
MVWPFTSSSSPPSNEDPLRDIDPSLREFLKRESPYKYDATTSSNSSGSRQNEPARPHQLSPDLIPSSQSPPSTIASSSFSDPTSQPSEEKAPNLTYSLYPDGRYAHLWKNYTPLNEVESRNKSDSDRLMDIVDAFQERKAQIGRAALENCSFEHLAVSNCFKDGGIKGKFTMCRAENKSFERCYTMQSRFLRALGYLSAYERPTEVDEDIQVHADDLYHQMLEREEAQRIAKEQGQPAPQYPALINEKLANLAGKAPSPLTYELKSRQFSRLGAPVPEELKELWKKDSKDPAAIKRTDELEREAMRMQLSLKTREGFNKKLEGLTGEERELEKRSQDKEIEAGLTLRKQIDEYFISWQENKKKRKQEGTSTFGDKVSEMFVWK